MKAGVFEASACLWEHLADMRSSEGSSHVHYNIFYNPSKHDGPLLPPAAALAPTLWPQFHLRWACPSEAQSSQVEAQCRNMMGNYSDSYDSFKSAVAKLRTSGEKKSAFFGIALNQMGLTCVQRFAINEAVELFEEAKVVLEQECGPEHPDTLGVYSNLAGTYDAMGR